MGSSHMKWRIALPTLTGVFGVVLFICSATPDAPKTEEQIDHTTAQKAVLPNPGAAREASEEHQQRTAFFMPITGGGPHPRATVDPFSGVPKTRKGLPFDDDPFVAESLQEQQWLDRNGYPNAKQWATYSAASDLVLEVAAASGDNVASVMLAARQLARGDTEASGRLMTAGMSGSSFALSLLAAYLANGKNGNPELGYAVSRLIELRGDWRSGIMREEMYRTPLSPMQKVRAESEAMKLLNDFRSLSGVQLYIDPRPPGPRGMEKP